MKIKELQKNKKRIHQKLHREEFQQYGTSILVDNIRICLKINQNIY